MGMRMVCEECKKVYDYEKDDFCPRCGAYNQPNKTWSAGGQGRPVRVDGVNEANHEGSFAHREVHREKAKRCALGMDHPKGGSKAAKSPKAQQGRQEKSQGLVAITVVVWLVIFIGILQVLLRW